MLLINLLEATPPKCIRNKRLLQQHPAQTRICFGNVWNAFILYNRDDLLFHRYMNDKYLYIDYGGISAGWEEYFKACNQLRVELEQARYFCHDFFGSDSM